MQTSPEKKLLLHLQDVRKIYTLGDQEVHALDGINLDIYQGEFVAIMGPSGSGKSTLLNMIGCLDAPTSGTYELDGIDVSEMDETEQAHVRNQRIGFVFQGFNLLARTTALKNVALPLVYGHRKDLVEVATAALEKVGLGDRLYHKPSELSGGQQQRVAIARALTMNPPLILADEPTGNLSTEQSDEIMSIFQQINDEGRTVVMVTHEPDIAQFCKRMVIVRDGKIVQDGPVKNRRTASNAAATRKPSPLDL
jgi:putative ABC transport system ATP-binding protein